ncbi:MAG: sensor histidine kinase [archaeon]
MVTRGLWNEKPVFFGICRDISERLEYERLIEEELKKLMQLDKIRKDLISRVSHELKTPLMNIRGATELMTDFYGEKLTEELKELVQIIKKGESRLEYLVNNLLDISRIQYKKLTINRKPTNITKLIKDCCQDMKSFIRKRNINLKLNLYEDLIINVDKGRIEQVIKNLISNAIKNSPPDEEIEIITKKSDELLEIMVDDNGVGLTQEEKKKLFKRFGKIERYEKGLEYLNIQGSGLGLYISKKIIDLHNGSIIAKSDGRNKGATFVIQIPIKNI